MTSKEKFEIAELEKFFEKYEPERIHSRVFERIITLIIAALGLIAALAWDEALKHIFEVWFGSSGTIAEQLSYAIVITAIAAIISVQLGKASSKRRDKKDK